MFKKDNRETIFFLFSGKKSNNDDKHVVKIL